MRITFEMINEALKDAEATIKRAETYKSQMARFLTGRLKGIDPHVLKRLKKELQNFNSVTHEWKE
mgnify:CR=1 FL=1